MIRNSAALWEIKLRVAPAFDLCSAIHGLCDITMNKRATYTYSCTLFELLSLDCSAICSYRFDLSLISELPNHVDDSQLMRSCVEQTNYERTCFRNYFA